MRNGLFWGSIMLHHCEDTSLCRFFYFWLTFLLTSYSISALFKRGTTFPWNNYLFQCCESMAESPLGSDMFMVALVRMQRVADRAYSMLPGSDVVDAGSSAYLSPLDMVINNVRRELYEFFCMQPESVKNRRKFDPHVSNPVHARR